MKGIPGVEQYMPKVKAAIERHLPWPSDAATDIYNRAYEAVANAQQSLTARDDALRSLIADLKSMRCSEDTPSIRNARAILAKGETK